MVRCSISWVSHYLDQGYTALVPHPTAALATVGVWPVDRHLLARLVRELQPLEKLFFRLVFLLARAELTPQPLRKHAYDTGCREERLYPHLGQSGDGSRRVVRVQCAEYKVPGERSEE